MAQVSFDGREDYVSAQVRPGGLSDLGQSLRQRFQSTPAYSVWLFAQLSEIDCEIGKLYYLQNLSQVQIANFAGHITGRGIKAVECHER